MEPGPRLWQDKDYYAVLGVARDADPRAVTEAYRRLVRTVHEDVHPEWDEATRQRMRGRFGLLSEAHEALGPQHRASYDRHLAESLAQRRAARLAAQRRAERQGAQRPGDIEERRRLLWEARGADALVTYRLTRSQWESGGTAVCPTDGGELRVPPRPPSTYLELARGWPGTRPGAPRGNLHVTIVTVPDQPTSGPARPPVTGTDGARPRRSLQRAVVFMAIAALMACAVWLAVPIALG